MDPAHDPDLDVGRNAVLELTTDLALGKTRTSYVMPMSCSSVCAAVPARMGTSSAVGGAASTADSDA